jgi:hypothetical protein
MVESMPQKKAITAGDLQPMTPCRILIHYIPARKKTGKVPLPKGHRFGGPTKMPERERINELQFGKITKEVATSKIMHFPRTQIGEDTWEIPLTNTQAKKLLA